MTHALKNRILNALYAGHRNARNPEDQREIMAVIAEVKEMPIEFPVPPNAKESPPPTNARLDAAIEALVWCGGSSDFAPGGKAREGWEKIVAPILTAAGVVVLPQSSPAPEQEAAPTTPAAAPEIEVAPIASRPEVIVAPEPAPAPSVDAAKANDPGATERVVPLAANIAEPGVSSPLAGDGKRKPKGPRK